MGDMLFNVHENAIYGNPLVSHFSDYVSLLRHQPDPSDVASVEEVSQSRIRASYDETKHIVQKEPYALMNDRMWAQKWGQVVATLV